MIASIIELEIQCYENWKMYSVLSQRVAGWLGSGWLKHDVVYQRAYSRRPSERLHRRYTKLKRMEDYFKAKEKRRQEDRYRKGQLDPKPAIRAIVAKASTLGLTSTATATRPVVKRRRRQRKPPTYYTGHPYSLRSRTSADHNYASKDTSAHTTF